jgi:2-isopropylmalate synthase
VLDSSHGTGAIVRVLLETSAEDETWGTIGVHENVIEASWDALTEGLIVGLLRLQDPGRTV